MNKRSLLTCIVLLILVSLAATPVMAAMITCPSSCSCLLPAEAAKINTPGLCSGRQMVCGGDAKNEKYCYEKPVTTVPPQLFITAKPFVTTTTTTVQPQKCASGCTCLSTADGKGKGLAYCNGRQTLCGYSTDRTPLYCFAQPSGPAVTGVTLDTMLRQAGTTPAPAIVTGLRVITPATTAITAGTTPAPIRPACAAGCACLLPEDARKRGLALCNGTQTVCTAASLKSPPGIAAVEQTRYCYALAGGKNATLIPAVISTTPIPVPARCPESCSCLDDRTIRDRGYSLCGGNRTLCGYSKTAGEMYCADTGAGQGGPGISSSGTAPATGGDILSAIGSFFGSLFGGSRPPVETTDPSRLVIDYCRSRYGLDQCSDGCVNLSMDDRNCGRCGNACYDGELCCSGRCVKTTSATDCGRCGRVCPAESPCQSGTCDAWGCYYGNDPCGNTCVNLDEDPENCGSCGHACPSGAVCRNGECQLCIFGHIMCQNDCLDPSGDRENCGSCRNTCADGAICVDGTCTACPAGTSRCGNTCKDLAADPGSCGRCGLRCSEYRPDCCNGTCTDLHTNTTACGSCGNACGPGEICQHGTCAACPAGTWACDLNSGSACVDLLNDEGNCGSCGHECPRTMVVPGYYTGGVQLTCVSGHCQCEGYEEGRRYCDGRCIDTSVDPDNCGSCGRECYSNMPFCVEGRCCATSDGEWHGGIGGCTS